MGPAVIVGDLHGQYYDLLSLLDSVGFPNGPDAPAARLVFLGDYVDRGQFSCEVLLTLLALKVAYPTRVTLLRGNHESESISSHYGFKAECEHKYGLSVYLVSSQ
jgi:hypothetical protein